MTRKRIWIPEYSDSKVLTKSEISASFRFQIGGIFTVELIEAATGRVKQRLEFPNLITDAGLNAIVGQADTAVALFIFLGVGTDSTAPVVGDTTLGSEVDRTSSNGGFADTTGFVTGSDIFDAPFYFKKRTRLFLEGEGNGNLTELAWFKSAAASTMIVRSLFKDSGGTPITVTKTSSDQLKITHELRSYIPIGTNPAGLRSGSFSPIDSGTVVLGSTTHSWTSSALLLSSFNAWGVTSFGAGDRWMAVFRAKAHASSSVLINVTGTLANFEAGGSGVKDSSFAIDAYVAGTFERTGVSTWEPGVVNFGPGGIKGFSLELTSELGPGIPQFQVIVSESIPKTDVERLKIKWKAVIDRAVFSV